VRVRITRLDRSLPLPRYATDGAAGFDLYARHDVTVAPGAIALIPTNVIIAVPDGYTLLVALRSSTPRRKGLIKPNGVGIIDADYAGPADEIQLQVLNITDTPVHIARGERIGQGLIIPLLRADWEEAGPAGRSRGGFGSTGSALDDPATVHELDGKDGQHPDREDEIRVVDGSVLPGARHDHEERE